MGEREMFDFWSDTYKVHHVEWTQEKAALVLETWQRRFSEVFSWAVFACVLWFIWSIGCVNWSQLLSLISVGVKIFFIEAFQFTSSFTPVALTLLFMPQFHEDHCSWRGELQSKQQNRQHYFVCTECHTWVGSPRFTVSEEPS